MFNMAIVVQFGKKTQPSVSMGLAQEMEKKREREREREGGDRAWCEIHYYKEEARET